MLMHTEYRAHLYCRDKVMEVLFVQILRAVLHVPVRYRTCTPVLRYNTCTIVQVMHDEI